VATNFPEITVASVSAPARENASLQILFKCPTPGIVFRNATKPSRFAHFDNVHNPLRLPRESTSERPKVLRSPSVFSLLTSKCASRHNDVHFLDIATSKSVPKLRCFVRFTFWLRHVLRATTACGVHFFDISTSKSALNPFLDLTSRCAFRHNGVQLSSLIWLHGSAAAVTGLGFSTTFFRADLHASWPQKKSAESAFLFGQNVWNFNTSSKLGHVWHMWPGGTCLGNPWKNASNWGWVTRPPITTVWPHFF